MKLFTKYLGYIILISAFFRIIPIVAGVIYGEPVWSFFLTGGVSLLIGAGLLWYSSRIKVKQSVMGLSEVLILVALSFIIMPLISAISFMPSFDNNYLDASFEAVSGFTTTGLTLYDSLDGLPKSLLLWRAEMQWMGGIGIVMVFLFVLSRLGSNGRTLEEAEAGTRTTAALYRAQGFAQKLEGSLKRTTENVISIYFCYTALGIVLLSLVGMPLFEAIGMTFTSLSTGGFTLSDTFYNNDLQLLVLCVLMLLGSISFITHNKLLHRKFKNFFGSAELKVFFLLLFIAVLFSLFVFPDVKVVVFELISASTTTGYSITEIALLPHLFIMFIMIGMMVGGGVASTAGGIKVARVYTILKTIPWYLKKIFAPAHAVIPFKIEEQAVEEKDLLMISTFVLLYIMILFTGTMILLLFGHGFMDAAFQMTSALGTVGLQTIKLAGEHWVCKLVLMIGMLLGRLEIFPLLVLVRRVFKWS
jgi:trk system potassium uptake protein TrkH